MGVNLTDGTANDHAWEEESSWYVSSISDNSPEIPDTSKNSHLQKTTEDTLTKDIPDETTFSLPEKRN